MRIALCTEVFLPKIDGITNRLSYTIKHLLDEGHEVLVFAPSTATTEYLGARIVRLPGVPFRPYSGVNISFPSTTMYREMKKFRPDVMHAVGPACLGAWGIACAKWLDIPIVASYHTDFPRYIERYGLRGRHQVWRYLRLLHNSAAINLCPSKYTQTQLRANGIESVGLWRGGVDTRRFRSVWKDPRGQSSEASRLLFVGRLGFEKHVERLLPLVTRLKNTHLTIVGDGPARPSLERVFPGERTHFRGFLKGEELSRAYASADVFVNPSCTETLGFVTIEALASGVPVVGAKAGGTLDLIEHGCNGLLFEPNSEVELCDAVNALIANPQKRRRMGTRAQASAQGHSWESETQKLTEWYQVAIAQHQPKTWKRLLSARPAEKTAYV